MESDHVIIINGFVSPQERQRLVRLCTFFTGNRSIAEDLAQETLLEAWTHLHELRDTEKQSQWLSGIARNVCLRWIRKQGREQAYLESLSTIFHEEISPEDVVADEFDLELVLERKELIELLDRALGLLPPETRTVLIKRYVEDSSLHDIAVQLGINLHAVAMRLSRGKLALRRVLITTQQQELLWYGVPMALVEGWDTTRYWCVQCGQHRLLGKLDSVSGSVELRCPTCCPNKQMIYSQTYYPELLKGVRSYKAALGKITIWSSHYYLAAMRKELTNCIRCGHLTIMQPFGPHDTPEYLLNKGRSHGLCIHCPSCGLTCANCLDHIVLSSRAGQKFCSKYPRIRLLAEQILEIDGREAALTTYESVTENARLDVISALDTFDTISVYGADA